MSGFDDPIPAARTGGSLVGALSAAQDMPVEALDAAVRAPGRIADAVLAVLVRANGSEPPARDANLLFWGVHVLGAARDARLCAPLLGFLRRSPDTVAAWLGEAVTTTLPRIVLGCFDGEAPALFATLADPEVDEFVRWSLFGALAALTQEGRIDRTATAAFLARFDAERPARAGDAAWAGWADAIALLGLADLAALVQAASDDARLLLEPDEKDELNATLAGALARPDDPGRFAARDLLPFGDLVADLEAALDDGEAPEPSAPVTNPLRSVGRNDPCPCGSGRKFKKCCLPVG